MNFTSVSGKKWIFKQFNVSDIKKYSEDYSLSEIVSKLIAIRKKNIKDINLFLNPTIKSLLPDPSCLKDMENAIGEALKGNVQGAYEFRILRKDDEIRYCMARTKMFSDETGMPQKIIGTIQDFHAPPGKYLKLVNLQNS